MKVILFHTEECPNYQETLEDLETVLNQEGVRPQVELIKVKNPAQAETLRFLGSPTIRVNGLDIEETRRGAQSYEFGLGCRIYRENGTLRGSPPREMIQQAIRKAQEAERAIGEEGWDDLLVGCCG